MRHRHRRRLGQHFLVDSTYRHRILEALGLTAADFVIEIGAGTGAMTLLLAERAGKIVAIELDPQLALSLTAATDSLAKIEVLQADILSVDLGKLCRRHHFDRCFVFGNLPYYITSPIVHRLLQFSSSIRAMGLLVQREVAERLIAEPGTRDYGYLSVLVQFYSRPRIALDVPAGAFSPAPKVQSSLVLIELAAPPPLEPAETKRFLEFSKRCFAQKRKTLVNNLAARYERTRAEGALAALGLALTRRAEELSVGQLVMLFRALRGRQKHRGIC